MKNPEFFSLFLCGDVMIGRGIDQILPHPVDAEIHEDYLKNAADYVGLAERTNGPIPRPVDFSYIWGDALEELERMKPQVRIINLETSVTTCEDWEQKGINYRMHPSNAQVLSAAKIDICSLANNHILDWGGKGLVQSLTTLRDLGIRTAGAGLNLQEAEAPVVIDFSPTRQSEGRVLFFSMATESSGVPPEWAAGSARAGVNFLADLSMGTIQHIKTQVQRWKRPRDLVIVSIHWGGNWGYSIPVDHCAFARNLLSDAGVDLIHGHSSHHVQGIEVYQGKLIIYGCGDFINDYEGIRGHEEYRGDLPMMFFPNLEIKTGKLVALRLVPLHLKRLRLERASPEDAHWLKNLLDREGKKMNTGFKLQSDHSLLMYWH
jgi:poly-gamma-glutamate synthesis protein (capsule biosynthesis protein)